MNINVVFQGLQNFFKASAYGARLFGNVPFFGPGANQAGAAGGIAVLVTKLGRFGAALTSLTLTMGSLASSAIFASRRIAGFGLQSLSMGGTTAEGLQLRGFAGAAGMSMGQMGALGEQVGGFNRAGRLLQEINTIRGLARWEDVLRYTRGRGLEALQATYFLTNRQVAALRQEAQARSGLYGLQATARAVQFNYELDRLQRGLGDLAAGIGGHLIPPIASAVEWLNRLASGTYNLFGGGGAQERHTEAMRQHSAALQGGARTMGGGARAQNAIPPAMKGEQFNAAARGKALTFGALVP